MTNFALSRQAEEQAMKLSGIVIGLLIAGLGTCAAHAETNADLAKKCQDAALKAHPKTLPDRQAAANLRNQYYKLCVARQGKIGAVRLGSRLTTSD